MARVSRLCEDCPTLLDAILPHTDGRELAPKEDELDFELDAYDRDHQRAAVIGRIFYQQGLANVSSPFDRSYG